MRKYYTRPCNFYYGKTAKKLIKNNLALPLCGNVKIAFDKVEIFTRVNKKISSKLTSITGIKKLNPQCKRNVIVDLKKITSKRKNFLKNINFLEPSIMGVLNITPDSFSDGGKFLRKKNAKEHLLKMIDQGAKIIDIGGESTRPGSKTVLPKKEWARVESIIKNFKKYNSEVALSVDTRKAYVMLNALKYGVDLINDVSGFKYEDSLNKLKKYNVAKVLHHMQGTPNTMQKNPKYKNVLLDIFDFFEEGIKKIRDKKIILDPGIGFGKTLKHNLSLINGISLFHSLGFPILIGTSRKRFISQISEKNDSKERIGGTIASVLFLMSQGVQIFRVHDVNEVKQSILVYEKILLK